MRPQVLALCAMYLLCFLHPAAFQSREVPVCLGTKNGLSFTDSYAQHYSNLKDRYTGCEIILGNLEINLMEPDFDLSFLGSIREVTGYVLVTTNQVRRLPLEKLRMIRGNTLYDDIWALAVFLNFEGDYGLVTLGLTHLTEILKGGVQIFNNRFLTYAPWINWHDIVRDSNARIEINKNGEKAPCHTDCGEHCWGPSKEECQILTKTVCAPQCHGRCFGTSPQDCCDIECAGGCTGPLNTQCLACRHVNHLGACVPHCPQPLIYNRQTFQLEPNPNAMYQYGSICMDKCPDHFVVDGSACVSSCPPDKMEVDKSGIKQCELCNGLCPKVCEGTGPDKPQRQTVDSSNIDSFINCTEIHGSLHFLTTGIKGDSYNGIPPLDAQKLTIFSTVREITGILNIQSWPEELSNLLVFSNLVTIRGRSLQQPFSLLLMKAGSIKFLGLQSLREISDGSVYISNNTNLCYHHTVNWTQIFRNPKRQSRQTDIKYNKSQKECEAEGCVCDPLCSNAGCWGPGPNLCLFCRTHSRHGTCVAQCNIYTGEPREFAEDNGKCLACHTECLPQQGKPTCTGEGADKCVACSNLMDGPRCVSSCPNGLSGDKGQAIFKYPNATGHCMPCHTNCTRGCKGPNLRDCVDPDRAVQSPAVAGIVFAVLAILIVCLVVVVLSLLYHRGLAIRRKRALRRYLESGESIEPLDPGEKGGKVHARILRTSELRKSKPLGSGVFGTVHKGIWIPEGDSVKIPVAIKTIQDRSGRQTFTEITDHMLAMGSLDHPYIVRLLGICPGPTLQLVTQLSPQGSLLQHLRQNAHSLEPQRLLNWCVQIAKGMFYLEEHRMVHRNLAARNVLLKSDYIVQVADFGVADLLYPDDKKYVYCEHKTPIKWMALESILFRRYSHQSDVWSYGVTVWEMMSNGAEPYAAMHPHDVPGLLEKGERLAQPQICTIDVYMVMVKCWMIDENIRPTFKELANEFTRMARDPPRYLVVKGDRNSAVSDESHPRELKRTEVHLDSDDEEVLDDGLATPPIHLSPSRSHSRLRIGSYRSNSGQSVPVGYLPMTASPGDDPRQLWAQRRRLGSARTASESSEGRSTMVDVEISELTSQTGSLRRGRSRIDSAYVSTSTSVSDPFSPGVDMSEVDPDGYVLPQSMRSSERDGSVWEPGSGVRMLKTGSGRSHLRGRPPRNNRNQLQPLGLIADPSQEYELMNRQPATPLCPPRDDTDASPLLVKEPSCVDPLACSTGLPGEEGSGSADTQNPVQCNDTQSKEAAAHEDGPVLAVGAEEGERSEREPSEGTAEDGVASAEGLPQQAAIKYEYMDIRMEPEPELAQGGPEVRAGSSGEKDKTSNGLGQVKRQSKEDAIYQNTCELPALNGNVNKKSSCQDPDVSSQPDEYEDMGACKGAHGTGDQVYQNIPSNGRLGSGEHLHGVKLRAFRGMCAGVDDKGNTSFDNPDYWHSRLFHKSDTVCT